MKKRRMSAKTMSLVLTAAMTVSLTACGGSAEAPKETTAAPAAQENKETTAAQAAAETEPAKIWTDDNEAEITIMMPGGNTPDEDNIVLQELEKQTGTKINMIYVPHADYTTKLNTMIAADNIPDIFSVSNLSDIEAYKSSGLIADVEDVMNAAAPNVIEATKDIIRQPSVNVDGIYMVPNTQLDYGVNVNIRTDWLENLGLEMPTDLDSFAKVMHAFTYDDPDGNGQDDTFGYSFSLSTMVGTGRTGQNLFGAFGIAKGHAMVMEDGTVTSWVKHPKFLDAMRYLRGLVQDGVCEPDYISIPNVNMFEKLWNGTSGCIEWECVGPTNNWMPGRYVEDPVPTFGFAELAGPDGDQGTSACYPSVTSGWVFSAKCKNLEGAARIANYCISEEGSDLLTLGVEDVMYKWVDKENGEIEYLNEYKDSATHRAAGGYCYVDMFRPYDHAEFRTLNKQTQEGVKQAWANGIDWAQIVSASQVRIDCGADMDQIVNEMFAELLTTDEDKMQEVYDDYINQWNEAGGTDWEAEVTQLWNEQQAVQ